MNPPLYDFAAGTLRVFFRTAFRTRAYGLENVPRQGALIVACNHLSYLDPPALCFLPRRIAFMAKKELFEIPVLGPLIRGLGAYPVDRRGSAKAAIKTSLEVLSNGGTVGIFPEGTRNPSGEVRPQTGVALLAALSGAAVLPVLVLGGDRAGRLGQMKVVCGRPLAFERGRKATRDDLAKFTADVMSAISALAGSIDGNS
ncbi:MAG TPA: lysophospholipid acyltransferase family protein [Candidatus Tumulicola sp.]|nr:lysophospholipid acyltransferase family protein [Candidatus Tumulicola sp.]